MKKPISRKQALMFAVIWTIGTIIWFLNLARPGESSFLAVAAAAVFTINAVIWWRRWYNLS